MCTIAAAALALTAVSTAASVYQQHQTAQDQNAYNQQQEANIQTAERQTQNNIAVTRNQVTEDASQQMMNNNLKAQAATSTALTGAGESGVTGTSVGALLRELSGSAGMANAGIQTNLQRQQQNLYAQSVNATNSATSQMNSLKSPQGVDWVGAGLKLGEGFVNYEDATARADARAKQVKTN